MLCSVELEVVFIPKQLMLDPTLQEKSLKDFQKMIEEIPEQLLITLETTLVTLLEWEPTCLDHLLNLLVPPLLFLEPLHLLLLILELIIILYAFLHLEF